MQSSLSRVLEVRHTSFFLAPCSRLATGQRRAIPGRCEKAAGSFDDKEKCGEDHGDCSGGLRRHDASLASPRVGVTTCHCTTPLWNATASNKNKGLLGAGNIPNDLQHILSNYTVQIRSATRVLVLDRRGSGNGGGGCWSFSSTTCGPLPTLIQLGAGGLSGAWSEVKFP